MRSCKIMILCLSMKKRGNVLQRSSLVLQLYVILLKEDLFGWRGLNSLEILYPLDLDFIILIILKFEDLFPTYSEEHTHEHILSRLVSIPVFYSERRNRAVTTKGIIIMEAIDYSSTNNYVMSLVFVLSWELWVILVDDIWSGSS